MLRAAASDRSSAGPNVVQEKYLRQDTSVRALSVGFGRQEIHLVIGRDTYDLRGVGEVMEFVEQRFEFLHRRNPEQRAGRLVGFVEIAMRDTTRQAYEV